MAKFLHPPFADKSCDTCQQPAKDGKVDLDPGQRQRALRNLPLRQGRADRKSKGAASRRGGRMHRLPQSARRHARRDSCSPTPCHACLNCHSEQAELGKKPHLHQPAFEQGCATCHEPHGGENQHLLRDRQRERALPGVPRPGSQPRQAGSRAPDHHLRRQSEAAGRLFPKTSDRRCLPLGVWPGPSHRAPPDFRCREPGHQGGDADELPDLPSAARRARTTGCW